MRDHSNSINLYLENKKSLTDYIARVNEKLELIRGREVISITDFVKFGLYLASNGKIEGLKDSLNKNLVDYVKASRKSSKLNKSTKLPLIEPKAEKPTHLRSDKELDTIGDGIYLSESNPGTLTSTLTKHDSLNVELDVIDISAVL